MIEQFKAALREVAEAGRNGDSILAHITPEEERYLEREFGSSTVNPLTGLKEYAGEPSAGAAGHGEGESSGAGSGSGGGGGADRGEGRRGGGAMGTSSSGGSGVGSGVGGAPGGPATGGSASGPGGSGSVGRGRGRGTPGISGSDAPGTGGMRGGVGGQPASSFGESRGASPKSGSAFSRAMSAVVSMAFGVPANPFSEDEERDLVGLPGALRDTAQAVGPGLHDVMSAIGFDPQTERSDVASADPQGQPSFGGAPPSGVPAGGGGLFVPSPDPVPPDFSLKRPEAMEAPAFLGLGNAMTPLQQRAKIATFGTGGESGGFRSDPAQEYFKNIFLRSVIGDEGQIAPNAQVLPVETQYAQQTLGLDAPPEMDIENFSRMLADLPPKEQVQAFLQAFAAANPRQQEREPI